VTDAVLIIDKLVVAFEALKAVNGVSISIPRGERRAIIGPNGAGKTTLFNAATVVVRPTHGRIVFDGRDITRLPPHRRARLGISRKAMLIRRSPNGAGHTRPQPGRDRSEQVVAINRNAWSQSIGIGGRNQPVRAPWESCGREAGFNERAHGEPPFLVHSHMQISGGLVHLGTVGGVRMGE